MIGLHATIRRLGRAGAVLVCLAGCGRLGGLELKNHCATSQDCAPGRVCVTGTCQAHPDSDAASAPDAPPDVAETTMPDAVAETVMPGEGGAGGDGGDADAGGDAPGSVDPCLADPTPSLLLSRLDLAQHLVGAWRICSTPAPPAEVSWLAGTSGKLQLSRTAWLPLVDTDGGTLGSGSQQGGGLYYFLLEANAQVAHFMGGSAGVDVAISVSAAGDVISFRLCDGATSCAGPVARFVLISQTGGI